MIYHTNIPFGTSLITLISLLTFPAVPTTCIFHAFQQISERTTGNRLWWKHLCGIFWSSKCKNHVYFLIYNPHQIDAHQYLITPLQVLITASIQQHRQFSKQKYLNRTEQKFLPR